MKSAGHFRELAQESRQASRQTLSFVVNQRCLAEAHRYELMAAEIERRAGSAAH